MISSSRPAWLYIVCSLFLALSVPDLRAGQEADDQPYLILISIDGFRWDYPRLFSTPALDRLAARGLRAEMLVPVFPTLTFPNHYTIVTGLYPAHHGLVANEFRDGANGNWYVYKEKASAQDGRWYGGEPIWVAAEKAGITTAAYYFVGTEADIQGVHPTYWKTYDKSVPGRARVSQVLEWLQQPPDKRPHVYALYFDEVDDNGHWYGPESRENAKAVERVDKDIGYLLNGLAKLDFGERVNVVVVSDHGQGSYRPDPEPLILDERWDLSGMQPVDGGPYVFLYFDAVDPDRAAKMRDEINETWDCGHAYRPGDAPAAWKVNDNPRFPGLMLVADPGCAVLSSAGKAN